MISLWKHYDSSYAQYEHSFPAAFPWNHEGAEDVPRYVKGEDGYWFDPQAKETGKALLCCVGDLMCEPRMTNAHRYGDSYFFHPLFQYVRGILKNSDFSVANLETTLTDCTPYAGEYHRIFTKYHCNAPECYLDALRYAGFDALVTANNHNCDSGVMGLEDTIRALDKHQFMRTGSFLPEDKDRVLLVKINGIRVAVLSYGSYYNRLDGWYWTQKGQDTWLNRYSKEKALNDIAYARQQGAEFILCYVHWGDDYDMVPNEEQYQILDEMKELDLDYIVGSHTHCLQEHHIAVSSTGHKIPMMYSMGNFVTNERQELCKHTGILQLMLRREQGKITVKEYFVPCYVFDEIGTGRYSVVPLDGLLNGGVGCEKMEQARDYIRNRIGPDLPELPTGAITLAKACAAMDVVLPKNIPNAPITKLAVQTGPTCPGALYFSTGKETPGDCRELPKRKLAAVVTQTDMPGLPCIIVKDVQKAYLQVCRAVQSQLSNAKYVLVVGASGKTVTRELIGEVLQGSGGVLTVRDDYQVDIAPWQNLHPYHEYCVMELREDNPLDTAVAVQAMQPHICVLTGMVKNLSDLVRWIRSKGLLLVNGKDAELVAQIKSLDTSHIRVAYYGDEIPACAGLPLPEMQTCAAAAYAVGREVGMADDAVRNIIGQFRVQGYTQNVLIADDATLILNMNCKSADSFASALKVFAENSGRKLAILSDWDTETNWQQVIKSTLDAGASHIFCLSEQAKNVCAAYENVFATADERELEKAILPCLQEGDTVLFNGGRNSNINITLRRLFGLTDGFIPDAW